MLKSNKRYNKVLQLDELSIELSRNSADIDLVLPNGQKIVIQYRPDVRSSSIDICFETNVYTVSNYTGEDLEPARNAPGENGRLAHVCEQVGQICIEIPQQWIKSK